jgi:uncharacterized protein (TIGR00369 family)
MAEASPPIYVPKGFSPFLELVGVVFEKVEDGTTRCMLEVTEKLLNSQRLVHGGVTYTLADCGMGGAAIGSLIEGETVRTVETQIVYFRAAGMGKLVCDARVVHRSKRIAVVECEIKQRGQPVAKAIGTFSVQKKKAA